jgi:hypothetical protein
MFFWKWTLYGEVIVIWSSGQTGKKSKSNSIVHTADISSTCGRWCQLDIKRTHGSTRMCHVAVIFYIFRGSFEPIKIWDMALYRHDTWQSVRDVTPVAAWNMDGMIVTWNHPIATHGRYDDDVASSDYDTWKVRWWCGIIQLRHVAGKIVMWQC